MSDAPPALALTPPRRSNLSLLRRGPFARYAVGEAISMTGTWMQQMAQGWVVSGLTNQAFMLGAVNAASSVPMLLLTMYGGSVADKYDKRRVLMATQVVQIASALAIGWLVYTGQVQIWHIFTAAVVLGLASAFEMPSASALVPELVEKEEISSAIAIDRAIFHGTRLIGPALAGYVAYKTNTASAFFINSLSFVALMIALASIQPRAKGTAEEEEQRASGMKAGIDYVLGDKPTIAMLGIMASASLCIFPFMAIMMPLYARQELALDVKGAGLLMAMSGVGSLVAAIGLLSVPRQHRIAWMVVATADVAVSLFALSQARSFWMGMAAMGMLAVGTSLNYGLANTTVQERAPGPLRGRVSALAAMSFVGIMPFAGLGMTKLSDVWGMRLTMIVSAGLYALVGFLVFAGPGRHCGELPADQTAAVPVEV